jgi:hypothetical protein
MSSRLRPAAAVVLLAAAAGTAAGCGGGRAEPPVHTVPAARPASAALHPRPAAPQLVQIELVGEFMGTHDTLTVGTDGTATIVKAYGGGGYATEHCTLPGAALRSLRRAVADLPVDEPTPRHPSRTRPKGFYVPHPYFTVTRGERTDSFTADRIPADGAPFARHAIRLIHGLEGRCTRDLQRFHAG